MEFKFNPKKLHHLYVGLLMFVGGLLWWVCTGSNWALSIMLAGILVMGEDLVQHRIQVTHPEYRSPLNRLFQYAWHKIFGNWWPFGLL